MAATKPETEVKTVCANAIASKVQTMTSASSATAPISLRRRIGIAGIGAFRLRGQGRELYGPLRAGNPRHRTGLFRAGFPPPRRPAVAMGGRGACFRNAAGWRCDTADGIRTVDRRMEAGNWNDPASQRKHMARRVRKIPGDHAISATQPRHDAP